MKIGERIYHHGVPIDNLTDLQAIHRITPLLGSRGNHLITLTIQMYNSGRTDLSFNRVLEEASLVLPESTGLKLYSRIFHPNFGKISGGVYLARNIVEVCAETGKRVVLFGSTPDNRNRASISLQQRFNHPDIHTIDGEYQFTNPTDSGFVVSQMDSLSPHFALMAGNEVHSEKWINQWLVHSNVDFNLAGNFGMTIDSEAGKRWVPSENFHRFGLSWLLMLPGRTPKRRKEYLLGLFKLASLTFRDSVETLKASSNR